MPNPWLSVPLDEYEGHMNSPEVAQLAALADLFADAIQFCGPASLALLGAAGGNGLDHIDPQRTGRILAVDINPLYLERIQERFQHLPGIELHCCDLNQSAPAVPPVDLVHAALLLEHTGLHPALGNALSLLAPHGHLSVVLQLPAPDAPAVARTRFTSLQTLEPDFVFIPPALLQQTLAEKELRLVHEATTPLPSGKALWHGMFHSSPHAA